MKSIEDPKFQKVLPNTAKVIYSFIICISDDIIIENTTGTIKFRNIDSVLDREGESHGKVIIGVIAMDKGSPPKKSKTMPFTIDIVDINDQSPAFEKLAYAFKIPQVICNKEYIKYQK